MSNVSGTNHQNMGDQMFNGFIVGAGVGVHLLFTLGMSIGFTTCDIGLTFSVAGGLCAGSMMIGTLIPLIIHKVRNSLDEQKQTPYDPHQEF